MSRPPDEDLAHRSGVRRDRRPGPCRAVRTTPSRARSSDRRRRRPRPRRSTRSRTPCRRPSSRPASWSSASTFPTRRTSSRIPSGKIVGFDVDLMNAIAATLGLTPEYREADFAKIIPSIQGGTFNVGMSSFTDTKEREETVDFVTYFSAGSLWAQRHGRRDRPRQRLRQEGRGAGDHRPGDRRAARQEARSAPTRASRRSRSSSSTARTRPPTPSSSARPTRCRRTRR